MKNDFKLNDRQKDIICDKVFELTVGLNDEELKYAIYVMNFWKEERERQDKEIKELYGEDY